MKESILDLDNQLCIKLYVASNKLTRLYRDTLNELDLTYPQYIIMLTLWERFRKIEEANNFYTIGELSSVARVDKGALTLIVSKLIDKNLLSLKASSSDKRVKYVHLTEEGKLLHEKALQVPEEMSKCFSKMTADDFGSLNSLMTKFLEDLDSES